MIEAYFAKCVKIVDPYHQLGYTRLNVCAEKVVKIEAQAPFMPCRLDVGAHVGVGIHNSESIIQYV